MKAVVESIGKVGSRVRVGEHEMLFDQPTAVPGGEDRGPSPLDVMAVAVAACAHYYAAAYLHGRGLSTEGLSVEVEAEKERVPVSRIGRLSMKVRIPAGLGDVSLRGSSVRSRAARPTGRSCIRRRSRSPLTPAQCLPARRTRLDPRAVFVG